jgi:thiamine-phosphate pyrophosphorylase
MSRPPFIAMVTDRRRFGADEGTACARLVDAAGHAAAAGVDVIQVRERGLDDRRLLGLIRRIVDAVRAEPCRVVVNARTDVALAARAHGVHLRGTSPPASRVRSICGPDFLIGRSVHALREAVAVEREGGCDYLIFGSVFPSLSKGLDHPVAGIDALGRVCASVRLPVLAIGGIGVDRVAAVAAAGAAGIAAIDSFAVAAQAGADRDPAAELGALVMSIRASFASSARSIQSSRRLY